MKCVLASDRGTTGSTYLMIPRDGKGARSTLTWARDTA